MPITIQVAIGALALAAIALIAWTIPAINQMRRTFRRVEDFLDKTERDLKPALAELRETLGRVNQASHGMNEGLEKVGRVMDTCGEIAESIRLTNTLYRKGVIPIFIKMAAMGSGFRTGIRVLVERLLERR